MSVFFGASHRTIGLLSHQPKNGHRASHISCEGNQDVPRPSASARDLRLSVRKQVTSHGLTIDTIIWPMRYTEGKRDSPQSCVNKLNLQFPIAMLLLLSSFLKWHSPIAAEFDATHKFYCLSLSVGLDTEHSTVRVIRRTASMLLV